MKTITLGECRPFVRFSRFQNVPEQHGFSICAYDSRLFYCIDGLGKIKIEGKIYEVHSGLLLLWKPGVSYCYYPDESNPMRFLAINFDFSGDCTDFKTPIPPDREENFDKNKITEDVFISDAPLLNNPAVIENMHPVYDKLCEIHSEFTLKTSFFNDRCSGLLLNILAKAAAYSEKKTHTSNEIIKNAVEFMNENLGNDIDNSSIGKALGYHPNYINSLFVSYTGKSLHRYLQHMRLLKAIDLLQETTLPVSEISELSGFRDYAHFSKYFKQEIGYSPSKFKL